MNSRDRWVIDIVCSLSLKASEVVKIVLDRVEEAWRRRYRDF